MTLVDVANLSTCIGSKFGHQVAPVAMVPKLATRLHHMNCHIALSLSVSIELVSSSVQSAKGHVVCECEKTGSIDRAPGKIEIPSSPHYNFPMAIVHCALHILAYWRIFGLFLV